MSAIFEKHRAALFAAYAAGDYAAALRAADAAHEDCPERHGDTWYWRACLRSLLGSTTESVAALDAGLAEGAWWSPSMLDSDTDLDAVRPLPGFARVRAACEERRAGGPRPGAARMHGHLPGHVPLGAAFALLPAPAEWLRA